MIVIPPTNYMQGREGNPVTLIVNHWIGAGTAAGAIAHFQNPASRVSAHYLIRQDGHRETLVSESDTAYHAGNWNVNLISIGIEHEVTPGMPPTPALYVASRRLHRELSEKHDIPLDRRHVKEHREIVPTACPGSLDLAPILKEEGMAPQYVGQSASIVTLRPGEVALVSGIWDWGSGPRTITEKVAGTAAGRTYVYEMFPPADPDADPTKVIDSNSAKFIVAVTDL